VSPAPSSRIDPIRGEILETSDRARVAPGRPQIGRPLQRQRYQKGRFLVSRNSLSVRTASSAARRGGSPIAARPLCVSVGVAREAWAMAGWFGEETVTGLRDVRKDPSAVELLDLSRKGLTEIPEVVFDLVNLRKVRRR
jgi:hypothetical protein